ncbi:SPOR domain-containing protein [Kangiella marina]|uniref:SPOR domain-containing protein n=1 Tax=Kangiella marina TaxID=1079178 RepID=A0ABP8IBL4_9GAMM
MDIKLKHRLVGACVILALAVFFLPMILDSEKYNQEIKSQIPNDPVLDIKSTESSESEGSLTINLEEDEPEKAISSPKSSTASDTAVETEQPESKQTNPKQTKVATESNAEPDSSSESSDKTDEPLKSDNSAKQQVVTEKQPVKATAKTEPAEKPVHKDTPVATNTGAAGSGDNVEAKATSGVNKPEFKENAWVIQIGSFSNKENATGLVETLRNKGFRAYKRDAEEYTRVFVGPYPDEATAKQRTQGLEAIVGAPVKVIAFDPQGH